MQVAAESALVASVDRAASFAEITRNRPSLTQKSFFLAMEPKTGDVRLEMMTAADVPLLALVRKIRRLLPLIMSARDFRKAVLAGLLLQFLHTSVEWALFD